MRTSRTAVLFLFLALPGLLLPAPDADAQLRTQVVASGLSSPLAFLPDPVNPNTFFIVQQGGRILVLQNGVVLPTALLDLGSDIRVGGEQGLLGMAFPPDAATTGRFFVNFTDPNGDTVVARFRRSPAGALTVNPATRFDLRWNDGQRVIRQPAANHNGGNLVFGPDGNLFVGLGDGGGANDTSNNAQNPNTLLGKFLRINVGVPDGDPKGYAIPPDNPFLDGQPIAALGEIWSFGWRNPWRYAFDDFGPGASGALFVGDVGQGQREEVDFEPAGAGGRNYGWRIREGLIPTPGVPPTTPAFTPLIDPLFDYLRTFGTTVTGGYVYRGQSLPPAFRGRYFFADSGSSRVASVALGINPATGAVTASDLVDHTGELSVSGAVGPVVSFGRDQVGDLYLCSFNGRILKIVSAQAPGAPTGLVATTLGRGVTLAWQAPGGSPAAQGYQIEVGSGPGLSNILVSALGAQTSLSAPDVPNGLYYVRLRAMAGGVLGPPSNEVVVTISCPPPPPTSGSRGGSGNTVILNWNAVPGATSYLLEAGSAIGLANLAQITVTSPTLTATAPNGIYYVRVRSVNACGIGPPTPDVIITVP